MPVRPLIDSLLLYDPNRSSSTANVWVAHPSPSEEAAFGKLFMVISIDSTDRLNHEIISALQDQLKFHYYHSSEIKFSTAFEQALHQTNQHLHRLVIEGVDSWVSQLHCLVGVIFQDQLVISTAGRMIAYLLRRARMHDMLGGAATPPNSLRIFANIVEGQLTDQDCLLFCTPTVLDYFSLEKLRRTMVEHAPSESVRLLESALLGSEQQVALGALIIKIEGHADTEPVVALSRTEIGRPSTVAPQASMDSLIARERATEKLLTPSVWPSIRSTAAQAGRAIATLVRTRLLRRPPKRTLPSGTPTTAIRQGTAHRQSEPRWPQLQRFMNNIGYRFQSMTRWVWHAIRRRSPPQPALPIAPSLPRSGQTWMNRLVSWWQALPSQQRRLVGIGVILIFVFAATTVLRQNSNAPRTTRTATAVIQIDDYLTKAEAALLYGGEDTARSNLDAATALVDKLPNRSKADRAERQTVANRISIVRSQLSHLVTVSNPEIVAQLAETAPNLRPLQIYWTGDQVFSYDPQSQSGILVDLGTTDAPSLIRNTIDTGQPTTGAVVASGTILFATERQGFVELNLAKATWRPIDSTWPTGTYIVQSMSFFQNRIYVLDRATGDIIRWSRGTSSLGIGSRWLKEPASLKSGRAIAVDGSIFILQPNGVIEEYFNGRRGEFSVPSIDPALRNPTRLWTSADVTRIYLVDPSNKRIVVFGKNGKLIRQYQSGSWTSLADIAVSESTKAALILSGTTLYRLPLQD